MTYLLGASEKLLNDNDMENDMENDMITTAWSPNERDGGSFAASFSISSYVSCDRMLDSGRLGVPKFGGFRALRSNTLD